MSDVNGSAELLFVNGPVYTVDAARSWATAVAVKGGTIVAVGADKDVRAWMGPHTEVVDLAGRMLLPGFQDAHIHPPGSGLEMLRCNLSELYVLDAYERVIARVRGGQPRRAVDPGRRLVHGRLPGRDADEGGARRDRPRPSRVPDEPRRARRVGQLARVGAGGHHARHAGPP